MAHLVNELFLSTTLFFMLSVATAFAGILRGFSGFGGGLLLAPIYSLFMSPTSVVVVLLLLNLATTLYMLPWATRTVQWRIVFAMLVPGVLGVPLGLIFLHMVDATTLRRLVAVVVTLVSLALLFGWQYKGPRAWPQSCVAGLVSGYLTGMAGIGGPPVLLYLLSDHNSSPSSVRSVFIVYFGFVQVATLIPLVLIGSVTTTRMLHAGLLLPVYFIAIACGTIAHQRMAGVHDALIHTVSLLLLLATGVITFLV